ncbi:MAG: FkbM family methyltransferase [Pseudomonas sp.]|uniref:FkbM family methyltransferase n=1 Tax=Pseudomonas sp. TaxID=306 RepID=UPI003242FAAE
MEKAHQSPLVRAREKYEIGEIEKYEYVDYINEQHSRLFEYADFITGTDVAEICINASGVALRSKTHDVVLSLDQVDLHATPYTLLDFGNYEAAETVFLKSVFCDGSVFLDVGANLGWYSLVLARHCPASQVFAFEPIPSTVEALERNIHLNALGNIQVVNKGVSNQEGEFTFLFAPDVSGATSLKLTGQDRGRTSIQNIVCKTTTIDAFCAAQNIIPSLLKIDVEGAELMVVQGAEKVLQSTPIILMELLRKWSKVFGYHPNDVFVLLKKYGYHAWVFREDGLLEACPCVTEETVQTNYVFMHPHKHAKVISQWEAPIR